MLPRMESASVWFGGFEAADFHVNGLRVHARTGGHADGPPLLLLHGFPQSHVLWQRVARRLAPHFRLVMPDLRGYGRSDKPHDPASYEMTALVADLVAVLDTYLLDQVRYLGYSLGGRVGWQLAVDAPEHVERAVLGGIPDGRPLARLQVDQARAFLDYGEPVQDATTLRYMSLADRVPGNDLRALVAVAEGMRLGQTDPEIGRAHV